MTDAGKDEFRGEASAAAQRAETARRRASKTRAQLGLFGPDPEMAAAAAVDVTPEGERRGPGRPKGSKNKRDDRLRDFLAAHGFRMPELPLAQVALLDANGDVYEAAMARADEIIAWSGADTATPRARIGLFLELIKQARAANEALLPYGLAKVQQDVAPLAGATVILPQSVGAPVSQAQIPASSARRIAPPPMPWEVQENQVLSEDAAAGEKSERRT